MRCGTARTLLPLLFDGSISLAEYENLVEHLDQCPKCCQVKALYETPLPPLPPLPNGIREQFFRDLDFALEERLAALATPPPPQPSKGFLAQFGFAAVPWPLVWLSGVLIGALSTWAFYDQNSVEQQVAAYPEPVLELASPGRVQERAVAYGSHPTFVESAPVQFVIAGETLCTVPARPGYSGTFSFRRSQGISRSPFQLHIPVSSALFSARPSAFEPVGYSSASFASLTQP